MYGGVTPKRSTGELTTPIGDYFIDVHVELSAASSHPDVQRKHVVMLAREDFVTGLNDQLIALIIKPLAVVVGNGGSFLQRGVGLDHLARDEVLADAEMFKRALGL